MNDFAQHVGEGKALLAADLRALADDAESLLRHAVRDADAGYAEARERLGQRVAASREQLRALAGSVREGAGRAAGSARTYASENPWKVVGAAAATAVVVALLLRGGRR